MRRLCDGLVVAVFVGLAAKLAGPLAGREVREGYTSVCSWTNRRSPGLLPAKFCKHGTKYERGLIGCSL